MKIYNINPKALESLISFNRLINHFCLNGSLISLNIIVVVLLYHSQNKPLYQKSLFLNLTEYSVMGLRYQLRKLINKGFVYMENIEEDRRIKVIKPTNELIDLFNKILSK